MLVCEDVDEICKSQCFVGLICCRIEDNIKSINSQYYYTIIIHLLTKLFNWVTSFFSLSHYIFELYFKSINERQKSNKQDHKCMTYNYNILNKSSHIWLCHQYQSLIISPPSFSSFHNFQLEPNYWLSCCSKLKA